MIRLVKIAVSGLTALSLSLAPLPAAAGPDGEDIAKVIAGLAVLGVIAAAADDRNDRKKRNSSQHVYGGRYGSIEDGSPLRVIEGDLRRPGEWVPKDRGYRRIALPDRCLRVVSTSRGNRAVYTERCLKRHYIHVNRLPDRCRLQVRSDDRTRVVYGARCLQRDGWRVAGF